MSYLQENVINAKATVSRVEFCKLGAEQKPACKVHVELQDDPDIQGLEKTFFLTTDNAKNFFFKTMKEAFEWWGNWDKLDEDIDAGGIVGMQCRVSTEKQIHNDKTYYKVQFINHIEGRAENPLLSDTDKISFLASLKNDAKVYAEVQKAEGNKMPKSDKPADDDIPF